MRSDKELLELAAKAVGIVGEYRSEYIEHYNRDVFGIAAKGVRSNNFWNPLTDDGDALRLAVKLDMSVIINRVDERTVVTAGYNGQYTPRENHEAGPYAATRRAIVRAAAEIGATL